MSRGNSGGDEDKSDNERLVHCVSQKDCAIGGRYGWLSVEQRLHYTYISTSGRAI